MKHRTFKPRQTNAVLVTNIPANKNAISSVYSYFKQYGHIVSLHVDGTEAIIVYESLESAKKACEDPLAFLNNRFIEVHYHPQPNLNPSNLMQYINNKRVNQFSHLVNEQIENLIQETAELRKTFAQQNQEFNSKQDVNDEKISQDNDSEQIQANHVSKSKSNHKRPQLIADLRKQKAKLIIEAAKIASKPAENDSIAEEMQSLKDQIEDLQLQIEFNLLEEDSDENEDYGEDQNEPEADDNIDNANENESVQNGEASTNGADLVYEEVPD